MHFDDGQNTPSETHMPYLYKSQMYTIPSPGARRDFAAALKAFKPDILHASLPISAMDFNLPKICQELSIPLVSTFHNAFDKRPNFYSGASYLSYQAYAQNLAQNDRVIIFSRLQGNLLKHIGVSPNKIEIIPNAVDTEVLSPGPSEFRKKFPNKLIITYMGRIAPEKGLDDLLKVFKQLALPDTELIMMGDGSQKQLLQSRYSEVPHITWTGFLGPEERLDVLRGSDIFVLPSQVEGLSIALLEAMATGLACVATDVGADGEVLEKGAGIVIHPGRVKQELSFTLSMLRDHPDFVESLKHKARQRVLERYQLERNISAVENVYHSLIQVPSTI